MSSENKVSVAERRYQNGLKYENGPHGVHNVNPFQAMINYQIAAAFGHKLAFAAMIRLRDSLKAQGQTVADMEVVVSDVVLGKRITTKYVFVPDVEAQRLVPKPPFAQALGLDENGLPKTFGAFFTNFENEEPPAAICRTIGDFRAGGVH